MLPWASDSGTDPGPEGSARCPDHLPGAQLWTLSPCGLGLTCILGRCKHLDRNGDTQAQGTWTGPWRTTYLAVKEVCCLAVGVGASLSAHPKQAWMGGCLLWAL